MTVGGRLHPDVARARNLVRAATSDLPANSLALVAVSGGADSLALASAAAFVAERGFWRVGCVIVDHGLQEGSADIAARAGEQVREWGLDPVEVVRVRVDPASGGPEGAARVARYDALTIAAERLDARAVLLGHTLDDQAETVLMGLARGSGARSIAGMPPVDGIWRRPLLSLTRAQTEAACRASGIAWWHDPHNDDPAYTRVRVRNEALPALEAALGPGVREALARTASMLRADGELLDELAAEAERDVVDANRLSVAGLAGLAPALRTRVIHRHARRMGSPPEDLAAVHVFEVDRLVTDWHGQGPIELPGRLVAEREDDTIVVRGRT